MPAGFTGLHFAFIFDNCLKIKDLGTYVTLVGFWYSIAAFLLGEARLDYVRVG